jgi:hypothetical protein
VGRIVPALNPRYISSIASTTLFDIPNPSIARRASSSGNRTYARSGTPIALPRIPAASAIVMSRGPSRYSTLCPLEGSAQSRLAASSPMSFVATLGTATSGRRGLPWIPFPRMTGMLHRWFSMKYPARR